MKKVLRGALVAGVAFAACTGVAASASAAESGREQAVSEAGDINVLNYVCALPWFWQGPFNVLVGDQDGSYSACNLGSEGEAVVESASVDTADINAGNFLCILPWFWQGPVNAFLGSQNGSYSACNGSDVVPEVPEMPVVPEGVEDQVLDVLPEGTHVLPQNTR